MSSYYFGARKRNLSSDTTGSSDNEEEQPGRHVGSFQNYSNHRGYQNYDGAVRTGKSTAKNARLGRYSTCLSEAALLGNNRQ